MTSNEKRIRAVCDELGIKVTSLKWEPWQPAVEMCGMGGGWILNDFDHIGLSTDEAIESLRTWYVRSKNVEAIHDRPV